MNLQMVEPGTLVKPGPVGRGVRLLLGLACLYALAELLRISSYLIADPLRLLPGLSLMMLLALCLFHYVVNIGFGKDWHRYPTVISVAGLLIIALAGFLVTGNWSTPLLGWVLLLWLFYFFAHLGVSFLLAALLAIPGCEMRAIPSLLGRLRRQEANEHHCPVSILSAIDAWEQKRRRSG